MAPLRLQPLCCHAPLYHALSVVDDAELCFAPTSAGVAPQALAKGGAPGPQLGACYSVNIDSFDGVQRTKESIGNVKNIYIILCNCAILKKGCGDVAKSDLFLKH